MAGVAETERRKSSKTVLARLSFKKLSNISLGESPSRESKLLRHSTPNESTNDVDIPMNELLRRTRTEPFVEPLTGPASTDSVHKKKPESRALSNLRKSISRSNSSPHTENDLEVCGINACFGWTRIAVALRYTPFTLTVHQTEEVVCVSSQQGVMFCSSDWFICVA